MKNTCVLISILSFVCFACTAPMKQEIDLSKLKANERIYTGNIQVKLNDKTNPNLTCEFFVNSDLNPMVRLSPDGNYRFKSIKKNLNFSKITCIHVVNNKKHWIYHSLDLPRITAPIQNIEEHLDNLEIIWTVPDSEFNTRFSKNSTQVFESRDPVENIGKLIIKSSPYSKTPDQQ